jgi:hypothetical protein
VLSPAISRAWCADSVGVPVGGGVRDARVDSRFGGVPLSFRSENARHQIGRPRGTPGDADNMVSLRTWSSWYPGGLAAKGPRALSPHKRRLLALPSPEIQSPTGPGDVPADVPAAVQTKTASRSYADSYRIFAALKRSSTMPVRPMIRFLRTYTSV